MRKRLVEGVTPGRPHLGAPGASVAAPAPAAPAPAHWPAAGTEVTARSSTSGATGGSSTWDWELVTDRVTMRAIGTGDGLAETEVSLVGRSTGFQQVRLRAERLVLPHLGRARCCGAPPPAPTNLPRGVEFRRDRP